ncbi:L-malyl-CoA/beta-methylmalyl-CoA lyase [Tepidimonas alkaliphilus]|uniref:L-malyl-CoA/beta-methylmalyl-CoA lyase n=1 Tax=Tepidimonas alkaliphilus TaxID=2588942 RepID=A0A554W520_9BURK|nr:aldolase/citrate lyase family protein [Tepidimonas alkaliphilus]TSE18675.1 L-malyl-CoA/beta-methylmalyl-CoA lyase [Tepidimonas alkaliphilus]
MSAARHPREVLLGPQAAATALPACDHYAGVEARMRKSLALQAEWSARHGVCLFDVTLDCEDGAPVGGEAEHAALIVELVRGLDWAAPVRPRVGVRVHPVDHPAFEADVAAIVGAVGARLTHVMIPKVESVADVERAAAAVDAAGAPALPLHALIESPAAVHRAFDIAAHSRVASLSFGLMDFVSAHGGAIPASAMTVQGQFEHPLVRRAKLEIASAAHAHGKVPSHCVVTEFRDRDAVRQAAARAAREFGYTRMWSIHPDQIEPILEALRPDAAQVEQAAAIIAAAQAADWAPIAHQGHLHDRASYRYFWQVLERAHATGVALPEPVRGHFA